MSNVSRQRAQLSHGIRIEIAGRLARHLGECSIACTGDTAATGHGLQHRQPEPFVQARKNEQAGSRVKPWQICLRNLPQPDNSGEGYRGTILLLHPMTGEILAALSDEVTAQKGIPAFEQRREPASIVKLITASTALRSELDPDRFLRDAECQGAKRYSGGTLYCS